MSEWIHRVTVHSVLLYLWQIEQMTGNKAIAESDVELSVVSVQDGI